MTVPIFTHFLPLKSEVRHWFILLGWPNGIIWNSAVGNNQLPHCVVLNWMIWMTDEWMGEYNKLLCRCCCCWCILASWWSKCTWVVVVAGCPAVVVREMNRNYRWVSDLKLLPSTRVAQQWQWGTRRWCDANPEMQYLIISETENYNLWSLSSVNRSTIWLCLGARAER